MKIAVDGMGGDHGPPAPVAGALQAAREGDLSILLVGEIPRLEQELERLGRGDERIELVHSEEVVGMDEPATTPIRRKPRASVRVCAELVKQGRAQAMVTAGHSGAAMIAAKMVMGTVRGVDRPALAAVIPTAGGRGVLLDVGANVDAKPAYLRQFAVMGHFYAQELLALPEPRIGLLSIGEEDGKGSEQTREALRILKGTGLEFVGNVEGRDVFDGTVDVVVCDGFVGNVLLKAAESLGEMLGNMLREELDRSWRNRLGALVARPAFRSFARRIDYSEVGAAPLLGVEGGCFIAHGRSNAKAVASAVRRAAEFCRADLHNQIRSKIAELHAQEEAYLGRTGAEEVAAT